MNASTKASGAALRRIAAAEKADVKRIREDAPDGEARDRMIAEAAYYRAEKRGFEPGAEVEDWLTAEAEIEALLHEIV